MKNIAISNIKICMLLCAYVHVCVYCTCYWTCVKRENTIQFPPAAHESLGHGQWQREPTRNYFSVCEILALRLLHIHIFFQGKQKCHV